VIGGVDIDRVQGRAWLFGDDVNTDDMFPGFAMRLPNAEAARHMFSASRPNWTSEVAAGDIVVGGRNFGLGSSRPVPLLFKQLGVAAVVAEQFNSLFFRNCINYGFLAVQCPDVTKLVTEGDAVLIDLLADVLTVVPSGLRLPTVRIPGQLLAILKAGGLHAKLEADGLLRREAGK
jgi:3-isopropylmalate/(R)-2-methylmalate dehydratase small subunit